MTGPRAPATRLPGCLPGATTPAASPPPPGGRKAAAPARGGRTAGRRVRGIKLRYNGRASRTHTRASARLAGPALDLASRATRQRGRAGSLTLVKSEIMTELKSEVAGPEDLTEDPGRPTRGKLRGGSAPSPAPRAPRGRTPTDRAPLAIGLVGR